MERGEAVEGPLRALRRLRGREAVRAWAVGVGVLRFAAHATGRVLAAAGWAGMRRMLIVCCTMAVMCVIQLVYCIV